MRILQYKLSNGTVVTSYEKAKNSKPYELALVEIGQPKIELSDKRKVMRIKI